MMEEWFGKLERKENLRENLSLLREAIKDEEKRGELSGLAGDGAVIIGLLAEEDPKVRKSAALLLGELGLEGAREALLDAYKGEETLFVKSAYLHAIGQFKPSGGAEFYKERLAVLTETAPAEEEKKHIDEEIRELRHILFQLEGTKKHVFRGFERPHEMLLAVNRELQDVVRGEVAELPPAVHRRVGKHPMGVPVYARDVSTFSRLRTYRELLFPLHCKEPVRPEPERAAAAVWASDLFALLAEGHGGEEPFYFRLEVRSSMESAKKGSFAKRFCAELERVSGQRLINSTEGYEVEIRLVWTGDGVFLPFLKLFTLKMRRFSYRKNVSSASIHPSLAAALVWLAKPHLKEGAAILDPFCGVGTMLVERDLCVPAGELYGVDIYGDAVRMAEENAELAGEEIHFINRDYFDFQHKYQFDEIITDMPVRGKKTKEEMDGLYKRFFDKSEELLAPGGMVILYSNEESFVKKQIRLHRKYRLLEERCVRESGNFCLYVIGYRMERRGYADRDGGGERRGYADRDGGGER